MFKEEIQHIAQGKKELWIFAAVMAGVFSLLGWFFLEPPFGYSAILFAGAIAWLAAAWLFPHLLKPIHKLWMSVGIIMGIAVTYIILTGAFYLLVTPIALLARMLGKDFLRVKFQPNTKSYWVKRPSGAVKDSYEKQF